MNRIRAPAQVLHLKFWIQFLGSNILAIGLLKKSSVVLLKLKLSEVLTYAAGRINLAKWQFYGGLNVKGK